MTTDLATKADAAAAAANALAKGAQPRARNLALTLADHHDVVYALDCGALAALSKETGVLAGAARVAAAALDGRDGRMRGYAASSGLHEVLRAAVQEAGNAPIGDARAALHAQLSKCTARTATPAQAAATVQARARNLVRQKAETASTALWELAKAIDNHVVQLAGVPSVASVAADLAVIVEPLTNAVTNLESAVGFEVLLINCAFREAGMERAAAKVNEPLVATGRALYQVRMRLKIAAITVQTGADDIAA